MMVSLFFFSCSLTIYILQIKNTEIIYGPKPYSCHTTEENPGFLEMDDGSLSPTLLCHKQEASPFISAILTPTAIPSRCERKILKVTGNTLA